jgi:hypothetical protein
MKRLLLFATLLFYMFGNTAIAQKDTCKAGIYITNLYDFKMDEKSFMADFWLWFNYRNDSLKMEGGTDITNSKSADFSNFSLEKKSDINWVSQKCRAQISQQWDLSCFPFDRQVLKIDIEDSQYDTARMVYTADILNSRIDPAVNSTEWDIKNFTVKQHIRTYATSYGDPLLAGKSTYPGISAEITLQRKGSWVKLMKMLTGAYVAFLISILVFFISSENQDSRYGLCVGGLFTAIGNKYIVESSVPSSSGNTLMDNAHNLTFIFILLIILVVTISLHFFETGNPQKRKLSLKIDIWSSLLFLMAYITINMFMIYKASC